MEEIKQQLGLIAIAIGLCFVFLYTSNVGQARRNQEIAQLQGEHPTWSRALCNEVARGRRISEERVEKHPAWPWGLIVERKIKPGMTEEMVRLSWGLLAAGRIDRSVWRALTRCGSMIRQSLSVSKTGFSIS